MIVNRKFILLFIFLFFVFPSPAYAVNIALQWEPNTEPELAGYRVFYREEGHFYDYTSPYMEVKEASCNIDDLDENKTYYIVVRAFSTMGFESGDSNEVYLEAAAASNNQPPYVNAGPDQTISLYEDSVFLNGTVVDDGLPAPSAMAFNIWFKVSGQRPVVFANPISADTNVSFSEPGTYVLGLIAYDGEFISIDNATIIVTW